ncbi:hypothetical protein [Verrucosispora sp. WMMD1129]|uniref:hypothetical protein n=1 Tax=Verrucosispora sp. WMMD1129 TaxID=3016093 RepID=UPI00249B2EC1|nr:hypothetical protein [Verrucosispora sp. WMMD1129]WFE45277.1 hypothetical protein O7624_13430 [Verrucosispora sp. WMMD1129]
MGTTTCNIAPKPPSKILLLAAALVAGITIGVWGMIGMGHFVFSGIPPERLALYSAIGFCGIATSCWLTGRYLIQRHRRAAWWDGFVAGDEPGADVIQISDLRGRAATPTVVRSTS